MNPLAQAEVCREQLPWAKPFIWEASHQVLHWEPGLERGWLVPPPRQDGLMPACRPALGEAKSPVEVWPGWFCIAVSWSLEPQQQGRTLQLAPRPSWPSAASAQRRHKPPPEPASVQAKGRCLACTGQGNCCSGQHRSCATAAERAVAGVPPAMCTALAGPSLYLKRKKEGERGNPAPLSCCKRKRAELIQTKLRTETPPRRRHFSVKFQPW